MIKVKFIGTSDLLSKGIYLVPGGIYEVSEAVAEYLEKTFGNIEKVATVASDSEAPTLDGKRRAGKNNGL